MHRHGLRSALAPYMPIWADEKVARLVLATTVFVGHLLYFGRYRSYHKLVAQYDALSDATRRLNHAISLAVVVGVFTWLIFELASL